MKYIVKTVLNNVIHMNGDFTYDQITRSLKWTAEPNPQPHTLMKVIEPHLGDDLNPSDSTSQHEVTSHKPRDKKRI